MSKCFLIKSGLRLDKGCVFDWVLQAVKVHPLGNGFSGRSEVTSRKLIEREVFLDSGRLNSHRLTHREQRRDEQRCDESATVHSFTSDSDSARP